MKKVLAIYLGGNSEHQLIAGVNRGDFVDVEVQYIEDNKMMFNFPNITNISCEWFRIGEADSVEMFVLKDAPDGLIEIEAIYTTVEAKPLVCCDCGCCTRVCGRWCSC